jgi:8-oxo-dGTP diphosphatase
VIRVRHAYVDRLVDLAVLEVADWNGQPRGCEGQDIRWVRPEELASLAFPAANLPVTTAVRLPRLVLVTPDPGRDERVFLARLEACVAAGVELVQLRLEETDGARRRRVARAAVTTCARHGARVMLNGTPGEALAAGADGVHLNAARLRQLSARPLAPDRLLSASCHNVAELAHAEALGVDFAYLSPVHATASHPGAAVLGWHGLHRLARAARVPVFALGGMQAGDARLAVRAGCQGVAMMRGIWDAARPATVLAAGAAAVAAAAYVPATA